MPTYTITSGTPLPGGALRPGDRYDFADGDEHFVGEVRQVIPVDDSRLQITLSMSSAEYNRLPVAHR
jgi:hypothetical protein